VSVVAAVETPLRATRAQLVEHVYRARYPDFLRVCIALTGDAEAAHDAVQEGFARGLRSLPAGVEPDAAEAWLWRVVTNAARDQRRRANVRAARITTAGAAVARDSAASDLIAGPLERLSERQRLVVFLRYYADLSYDQIAAALGVRPGTVAATLNAAHTALRNELSKEAT
jgi:RNA polymerase sigma factor (sigma-70 family)